MALADIIRKVRGEASIKTLFDFTPTETDFNIKTTTPAILRSIITKVREKPKMPIKITFDIEKRIFEKVKDEVKQAPLGRMVKAIREDKPIINIAKALLPTEREAITIKDPEKLVMQVFDVMPIGMVM